MKIENRVVYTLEEGERRVARGDIDVDGAVVIIDNITNDVRGTNQRRRATPDEVISRIDRLRRRLRAAGAAAAIVCAVKPMQLVDVSPYNSLLNQYLGAQEEGDGYGCQTQIRLEYLKADGFHIRPQFDPIVDKTYACAIMGINVPCPTPERDFVPAQVRRCWERNWPQPGARTQGLTQVHGR